jgi:ATP-dependent exoDNAse (exonuclease V) beta subunit
MTRNLNKFLQDVKQKQYAVDNGTGMHTKMQSIIISDDFCVGDIDIINVIKKHSELIPFFGKNAQTEVPIAGMVNGVLISRRIDRLIINHDKKTVVFIDYKTDTDKTQFVDKYKRQLREYAGLLQSAYPKYEINGYILWLRDWVLDKFI